MSVKNLQGAGQIPIRIENDGGTVERACAVQDHGASTRYRRHVISDVVQDPGLQSIASDPELRLSADRQESARCRHDHDAAEHCSARTARAEERHQTAQTRERERDADRSRDRGAVVDPTHRRIEWKERMAGHEGDYAQSQVVGHDALRSRHPRLLRGAAQLVQVCEARHGDDAGCGNVAPVRIIADDPPDGPGDLQQVTVVAHPEGAEKLSD